MSEETKKTSEEQEAEKEIPVTDGDQEEENLTRRYRREQSVQLVEWIRQQRKDGRSVPEIKELLAKNQQTCSEQE